MAQYRKKPVVIDVYFMNEFMSSPLPIDTWVKSFGDHFDDHFKEDNQLRLFVKTLEGTSYPVDPEKDVIIRGIKGEYYPCKRDIFEQTYEKV